MCECFIYVPLNKRLVEVNKKVIVVVIKFSYFVKGPAADSVHRFSCIGKVFCTNLRTY